MNHDTRYCECGCGRPANQRYLRGHNRRKRFDPAVHFWPYVDVGTPFQCWRWTRGHTGDGYGTLRVDGTKQLAHRVAYVETFGPIPDGMQLDHLCRNPICCNPSHLEAVTQEVNQRRGLNSKLTLEQAREIKQSTERTTVLAEQYGVSWGLISHIRHGRAWRDA